jgi:hypothetical protein
VPPAGLALFVVVFAAAGTPDRAHPGAGLAVKAPAVVDCQRPLGADGLVDDPLYPGCVERVETAVIQRRGDGLKRSLDAALTVHC